MNKILLCVVGFLVSVMLAIGGWWVNRVNTSLDVVQQLQFRSLYLNGTLPAAPVQPLRETK